MLCAELGMWNNKSLSTSANKHKQLACSSAHCLSTRHSLCLLSLDSVLSHWVGYHPDSATQAVTQFALGDNRLSLFTLGNKGPCFRMNATHTTGFLYLNKLMQESTKIFEI